MRIKIDIKIKIFFDWMVKLKRKITLTKKNEDKFGKNNIP
jgi:hypothetical protein